MYPKESLDIIGKMMNDTRLNIMRGAVVPLLVWGWTSFVVSIIVYLGLRLSGNYNWNYAWGLILIIGLPLLSMMQRRDLGVKTAIAQSLVTIWKMLATLIVVFSVTSFLVSYNVLSVIMIVLAVGMFVTGELIHCSFLKWSSVIGFALAASLWWVVGPSQILIFGIAMLLMMVLPAYKIKNELKAMI